MKVFTATSGLDRKTVTHSRPRFRVQCHARVMQSMRSVVTTYRRSENPGVPRGGGGGYLG